MPFGILAIPTHTELGVGRKLQYYFFPDFVIIFFVRGNVSNVVLHIFSSHGSPWFHKGCITGMCRHCGQSWPPSSLSPNSGGRRALPQRENSRVKVLLMDRGCFGNIFCSALILVSAEQAQTQCADHLLHFTAALLLFLGNRYFIFCSWKESLDFMGVKCLDFFLSYCFSLFDSLIHFIY